MNNIVSLTAPPSTEPGLHWLGKNQLVLGVNRGLIPSHVKDLTKNWDARKAGTIVVADRTYKNNELAVIDGQHRFTAAPDDTLFACFIVPANSLIEEIDLWFAYNTKRRTVSATARFVMRVAAGDPVAIEINNWVTAIGRTVPSHKSSYSKTVACVNTIEAHYARDPKAARLAFDMTNAICEGELFHQTLYSTLCAIVKRAPDEDWPRWLKRFHSIGHTRLLKAVASVGASGRGHNDLTGCAVALLKEVNRGLQEKRRLSIPGLDIN